MRSRVLLFVLLLLVGLGGGVSVAHQAAAQSTPGAEERAAHSERPGRPVVRHIAPQAYDGSGLVWDVAQDERGLLYIASSNGLQQYDGARWRYLATGNETTAQSIALDSTGRLHVGAKDELGYYRPDSVGRLQYRSLLPKVPASHRPVGNVWPIVATGESVYYRAGPGVLRWTGEELQVVTDETMRLFECRGTVFLQGSDGMYRADGTTLTRLEESEQFQGLPIFKISEGRKGDCEVFTSGQGRFALTDAGLTPRPVPGGPLDQRMVSAARGPGGGLAVATEWTLRLIGPEGTIHHLTRESGLIPGEIKKLHMSRRGALWVATTDGLARVAWPDPVSVLKRPAALQAHTGPIVRHDGQLMVSTEQGLWQVGADTSRHAASEGHVYSVVSTRAGLLAAGHEGLFVYREGRVRFLFEDDGAYALRRSRRDSSVVYAGLLNGEVLRLRRRDGRWTIADRTDRIEASIYSVSHAADTSAESLWLGTGTRGLVRLGPPLDDLEAAPLARFDTSDGLPGPSFNFSTQIGDSVRFPTQEGLYRFAQERFEPDRRFAPVYADAVRIGLPVVPGREGEVWWDFGGHKLGVVSGWPGDSLRWSARPYRRVADIGDVSGIYPDARRDSIVWFGAEGALVRYDRALQRFGEHNQPFRTLIRGVETGDDSLLYGGDTHAASLPAPVDYEHTRLRFQFGSTSFEQIDGPTHNWDGPRQYRWRLDGFDEAWSDWTTEAHADYTSLPPGRYTIRVQARNLYQVVGREASLSFTVLPPWYRTWWAYGGYGLLALGLVAGGIRWRTRRLRRRQEALEATVAERTEQIRQKNDELARQAEKLKELDEAKSRFFANVSHEFRTPLTLIHGPVQEVRERLRRTDVDLDEEAEQLAVVERNTDRLRRLVDQLLALARLDAGSYELAARPVDLGAETERIARAFEPLAERHGLAFAVEVDDGAPADADPVVVDREALEHILGNLLSNAIKFTPKGGRVTVTVTHAAQHASIAVADMGPGIPEDRQQAVFDRFQQGADSPAGDREGVGIGLAFAKDLVDLHGGTIALHSTAGEGTTVTVEWPRGPDHLADDQVAAPRPADEMEATDAPDDESTPAPSPSSADRAPAPATPQSPDDHSQDDPTAASQIVLIVDDNADVRQYVRTVLAPDYTVIEAADGEAGLARAREAMPDCILADVMMPEMDGVAMTRHLRQDPTTEGIPVVMLTARVGAEHEIEGLEAGADDYVTKPFDADVLRARVAGMIEVRRRLRRRIRAELAHRRGDGPTEEQSGGDQAPDGAPPQLVVSTAADEEPEFVRTVRAAIEDRLADPDLSVEQLASDVAVSRSTLYRRLKEYVDQTPSQFLRQVRIEHGARLLREQEGTVSEVAYAVGFSSLSYFSNQFREHLGQSPSEYVDATG